MPDPFLEEVKAVTAGVEDAKRKLIELVQEDILYAAKCGYKKCSYSPSSFNYLLCKALKKAPTINEFFEMLTFVKSEFIKKEFNFECYDDFQYVISWTK